MASEQARRENTVTEREVRVEKDRVPKMTSHFESIVTGETEAAAAQGKQRQGGTHLESLSERGNDVAVSEGTRMKKVEMPHSVGKFVMSSRDETKGKETEERQRPSLDDIRESRAQAQQMSMDTIRAAEERYNKAKDVAVEKGQQAKESVVQGARRAAEIGGEKGAAAKDAAAEKAQEAKEQSVSVAAKAKDTAVDVTKKAANYAGEKATAAKEATVEGGKGAAHYAGVVADKAAEVGWTAAHFTTEKMVQGTKAVAGTVEKAVGYTGHKAVEVGSKAVDVTKEKAAAAADTVVGYTAKKKEEARHGAEERVEMREGGEEEREGGEHLGSVTRGKETSGEGTRNVGEHGQGAGAGGVLGAIGETIVEIAQTTKHIVIGGEESGDEPDRVLGQESHYTKQEEGRR